jgi:hypothetical protein
MGMLTSINQHPSRLMRKVGIGARILDVGGGDRHLNLPNFVNLI